MLKTASGLVKNSKRVANWPNYMTVISTRSLFVLKISPLFLSPDRVIPVSFTPYDRSDRTSPSCHLLVSVHYSIFLQVDCDLVLEEAFEKITVTSKPIRLRVVCQIESSSKWSNFTDKMNGRILGTKSRDLSSSFSTTVVDRIIHAVISNCLSNRIIPSLVSPCIVVLVFFAKQKVMIAPYIHLLATCAKDHFRIGP